MSTITLHTMPFPVAEFHYMTGHLKGIERGALRDILDAQWMQEYKAVNLDDKSWFLYRTKLDPRQYQAVCGVIKPFFRKVPNKGYYFEFGEKLYYETMAKHLTNVEKGKKGATAKREIAKERLDQYNELLKDNKSTTNSEQVSDKPIHSDDDNFPENKESELVGLKHKKREEKNKKKETRDILDTNAEVNQSFHPPLDGGENPDKPKTKTFTENKFNEFWKELEKHNSGDVIMRYDIWKGYLSDFEIDEIGQHWHDNNRDLQTTTNLFKSIAN